MDENTKNYLASGGTLSNGQIPTTYAPTGQATYNAPTTINSNNLGKDANLLNLASTPPDTNNYNATIAGIPDYNELLKSYIQPTTQEANTNISKSRTQRIIDTILGKGGSVDQSGNINTDIAKNTANEQAIQNFGYANSADAYKQLTDVNNQLNSLKKEALAIPLQLQEQAQGKGVTAGGLAPIQTGQLRQNTIKSLGLASIAETIQGNISTASTLAEKAVATEFAPLQAQLNAEMFNYQQNKDALDREDKKKSDLLNLQLQERSRLLTQAQDDKKLIYGWTAEAAKNGAPTLLITKAQQSNNPSEVLSQLSGYMSDPTAKAQALANLTKTRTEITKLNNDIAEQKLSTTLTNQDASKYSGALSVILGSDKFTKEQKNALIKSVNQGQDPVSVIKNQAKNIMGQTEATKVTGFEVAKAQLDDVNTALKEYYANGGKTDIFRGNFEKVINKLGEVQDPKLVSLAVQISSSLQQYRNAVSGTAYSVQEGKDIASIFPGIDKSQGLNEAILSGRKAAFDSTIDASYRSVLGQTYDQLKASNVPQTTTNQTLSVDDAYAEYLKTTGGQSTQSTNTQTTNKSNTSLFPDLSGYKGFSLNSFFK